jgi:hypothetical protein
MGRQFDESVMTRSSHVRGAAKKAFSVLALFLLLFSACGARSVTGAGLGVGGICPQSAINGLPCTGQSLGSGYLGTPPLSLSSANVQAHDSTHAYSGVYTATASLIPLVAPERSDVTCSSSTGRCSTIHDSDPYTGHQTGTKQTNFAVPWWCGPGSAPGAC